MVILAIQCHAFIIATIKQFFFLFRWIIEKECTAYDIVEKNKIVQLIVSILCSVSYRMKHGSDLCTPEILNTLIQTCRLAFRRKSPTSRWDEQGVPLVLSHIVR